MRKIVAFLWGCFLLAGSALAAPVSESRARAIAAEFMSQRQMGPPAETRPARAPRRSATATTAAAYYVFNTQQDKGFVIVSGDDRTEAVLGYSDRGHFDANDIPANMQWWLSQYEEELWALDAGLLTLDEVTLEGDLPHRVSTSIVVEPMLKSKWGQDAPFYFQCPKVDSKYCVTGCVATAMAQIMYYHQWPTSTSKTIPSYTKNNITYSSLSTTTFNWSAMKDYYPDTETSTTNTANAAVARLMNYCGHAAEMNYGTTSSGTHDYSDVFVEYFRYSTKAQKLERVDYTYTQWVNFILTELEAKRPVMYGGKKQSGGHAFVCDGYDGKGYYHFNWGWYGSNDGYFLLTSLNPKGGGTGSIAGNDGYALHQDILIGLEPNTVATSEKNSTTECYGMSVNQTTFTRNSSSDPFVITVTTTFENQSPVARTYDLGWGVYDSSGHNRKQYYESFSSQSLNGHESIERTRGLNFGSTLANGTYYLRPICRETGNAKWLPCLYSGTNTIQAQINGNTLTLTATKTNTTNGVTVSINSYSTVRKKGRPLEITLNVTNRRIVDHVQLYLFANDELVGGNAVKLSSGSSGLAYISYIPTTTGANTIKVCADNKGENVYCTGSVNIETSTEANLKITSTAPQANSNNQISGNKLSLKATISNNKTTTYKDIIFAKLFKIRGSSGYLQCTISKPLNISGSGSTTQYFDFPDLAEGTYYVRFYYYNYDNEVMALKTPNYELGVLKGDVNGDGSVSGADVTALYNRLLNNTSVAGNADVNGDGSINGSDVTALYTILLN